MGKLTKKATTRRDAADAARVKVAGHLSHINEREDRLLREMLPDAAGPVIATGLLAEAGRRGDDRVTHLNAEERRLLKRRGGAGTRNPKTGLLEYSTAGGGGGEGGDNGVGGPGNGSEGTGPGQGAVGGNTSFSDNYGVGWSGPESEIGMNVDSGGWGRTAMPTIEQVLNTPNGYRKTGYEDLSMVQYNPPDTFGRLLDTYRYGPPPSYKALGQVPGRYGGPTGRGPGVMGTMAGFLTGNPMSAVMDLGLHMDQAMSPGTRAASLAENQAIGAQNSTGNQQSHDLNEAKRAALLDSNAGSRPAGTDSGANAVVQTAMQVTDPSKPEFSAALGGADSGARTRTGLPAPVENLLMDYIWRGRSGRGWGW